MRVKCLIQGDSWVALNNLLAPHNGASIMTADLADQNVSPKIGDAILVQRNRCLRHARPRSSFAYRDRPHLYR